MLILLNYPSAIPVVASILANHFSDDPSITALEAKKKLEDDAWARYPGGPKCVWNGIRPQPPQKPQDLDERGGGEDPQTVQEPVDMWDPLPWPFDDSEPRRYTDDAFVTSRGHGAGSSCAPTMTVTATMTKTTTETSCAKSLS